MTLPAELALIFGIVLGAAVTFMWRFSERQLTHHAPVLDTAVSPDTSAVLTALRSSAVLLRPDSTVIQASAPAHEMGLIDGDRLRSLDLAELVAVVQRDGMIRESSFTIERPRRAPAHVFARVAPLSSGLILVLVEDKTREHQVEALRRDFVANASHELKTPIGAIQLLAEAVGEASDDPQAVERFADRMKGESERLTRLVQQIIDLSRIQDDEFSIERSAVPLRAITDDAIAASTIDAIAKHTRIELDIDESAGELAVWGNHQLLLSAVSNLVENAVTYSSESGTVMVRIRREAEAVVLSVSDSGIGITPDDHDRIFERFYRVDPARARSTGGTGLGLSIVKHVVASHGGDVSLWSEPGVGSTFTITFPAWDSDEGDHGDPDPVS